MRAVGCSLMVVATALALSAPAAAAPTPAPYGTDDAGGFRAVVPPGENGTVNAIQLAAFLAAGVRPPHNDDQLQMYADLIREPTPFTGGSLQHLYKDEGFGVPAGEAERTYSPGGRTDVTIARDRYGVPHIYGDTKEAAMFAIGYATAEDRLFFMDVFRHLGRAQLSSFAGGDPGNRAFDALVWTTAPYTEAELTRQVNLRPKGYEKASDRLRAELAAYVDGINRYIDEAKLDPTKMPGEYAALNHPEGPAPWTAADTVATAGVVGAVLGVGGGGELKNAVALEDARARFGRRAGDRVFRDFRSIDDPESPTIVHGRRFPYALPPAHPRDVALPDRGSVRVPKTVQEANPPGSGAAVALRSMVAFPHAESNALLVSARESRSGHPVVVFGPQTGYFSPQALYEQDVHAPGLDARGVAFPGTNVFVELGRGRDYAWSATTSAQDVVDTYAVPLCDATHYRYHGRCLKIEVLTRVDSWQPNFADSTPAGSETLTAERTKLGIVVARGRVRGRRVIFTRLRSTYRHEADSGLAFSMLNDPGAIRGPRDFERAAALIPYTFNWYYVDSRHIAYQNGGANPIRARGTDPNLPMRAAPSTQWRHWKPGFTTQALTVSSTKPATHPHVIDQSYITDWNGKQGRGYAAADNNWGYGPVYRSDLLGARIRALIGGGRKATLPALTQAMAEAATVDMRGDRVLPWALRVIGKPHDAALRDAVAKLKAWVAAGAHRIDRDGDGAYEHSEAIRIMDAWWPLWMRAQFRPGLGRRLFGSIEEIQPLDNAPNNDGDHVGSAYQSGWYSYAQKDLRDLLGVRVRHRWSRVYCGGGSLRRCRSALERSLAAALKVDSAKLYEDAACKKAGRDGDQVCFDSIYHRPVGAVTQPLINWQNRPTFQQVVEIPRSAPR